MKLRLYRHIECNHYIDVQVLNMFRYFLFFFFNDTATTEIYTLSLHDALPISRSLSWGRSPGTGVHGAFCSRSSFSWASTDRKSTRLNSSHLVISYAVFCLKKKKKLNPSTIPITNSKG